MLNLAAVPSVNLYCKVHVTCTFKIGQDVVKLLMGSHDAHYKLLFDDSALMVRANSENVSRTDKNKKYKNIVVHTSIETELSPWHLFANNNTKWHSTENSYYN